MPHELDFENDAKIDESALDVEWLNQASLAIKYARHETDLSRRVDALELKIELENASLYNQISTEPELYLGKPKATVKDVEAVIALNKEILRLKSKLAELKADLDFAKLARREIAVTKKSALENLVVLYGQKYFAGPKVPRDLSYEATEREKQRQANIKVAQAMKDG